MRVLEVIWSVLVGSSFVVPQTWGQVRAPPRVESKPMLLDSFIPASMQIMAHLTELMKYDLKPSNIPTSTTTQRPTSSHKPAIYAPEYPPGPEAYFAKGLTYEEYIQRLQNPVGFSYFDRYFPKRSARRTSQQEPNQLEQYFSKPFSETLRLANSVDEDYATKDIDIQVQQFSQNFDDSNFRFELLRQKQMPPTKAYVSLLSLYDSINKETKKLGFNKYAGYTENVLKQLIEISTGTSAYQLRSVLDKIVQRQEIKRADILTKINKLIDDLDRDNSYINDALRYIPPLPFAL